jgi:hypothetical protein
MRYAFVAVLVVAAAPLPAQKTDSTRAMRGDIMAAIVGPNATRISDAGRSRHVSKFRVVGDTAWVTVDQVWRMGPRDTSSVSAEDQFEYYGHGRPRLGGITERREYRVERRKGEWVVQ